MHVLDAGVAAFGESAQQVQRRRRLTIGFDLAARIGDARFLGEGDVVDDVTAIARQFDAVALFGAGRARLGELAGNAADLNHRRGAGICQDDRHLQKDAEEIADVVGAVLGEAFGAIAALQQEGLAQRDAAKRLLQVARLTGENQRRKCRQLLFGIGQSLHIRVFRHLQNRLFAPTIGRPTLRHHQYSNEFRGLYTKPGVGCQFFGR